MINYKIYSSNGIKQKRFISYLDDLYTIELIIILYLHCTSENVCIALYSDDSQVHAKKKPHKTYNQDVDGLKPSLKMTTMGNYKPFSGCLFHPLIFLFAIEFPLFMEAFTCNVITLLRKLLTLDICACKDLYS